MDFLLHVWCVLQSCIFFYVECMFEEIKFANLCQNDSFLQQTSYSTKREENTGAKITFFHKLGCTHSIFAFVTFDYYTFPNQITILKASWEVTFTSFFSSNTWSNKVKVYFFGNWIVVRYFFSNQMGITRQIILSPVWPFALKSINRTSSFTETSYLIFLLSGKKEILISKSFTNCGALWHCAMVCYILDNSNLREINFDKFESQETVILTI